MVGEWKLFPANKPEYGQMVLAIIEHWNTKGTRAVLLEYTKEDDNCWRTTDSQSEMSYDWNVKAFCVTDVQEQALAMGFKAPKKYERPTHDE